MALSQRDRDEMRAELTAALAHLQQPAAPPAAAKNGGADLFKIGGAAVLTILANWALNQNLYVHKIDTNAADVKAHDGRLDTIERSDIEKIPDHETRLDKVEGDFRDFKTNVLHLIEGAAKSAEASRDKTNDTHGLVLKLEGRIEQIEKQRGRP